MTKYPIYLEDGNTIILSATLDLIYSPDENAWYFQEYTKGRTSTLYSSSAEALYQYANKRVVWNEDNED